MCLNVYIFGFSPISFAQQLWQRQSLYLRALCLLVKVSHVVAKAKVHGAGTGTAHLLSYVYTHTYPLQISQKDNII